MHDTFNHPQTPSAITLSFLEMLYFPEKLIELAEKGDMQLGLFLRAVDENSTRAPLDENHLVQHPDPVVTSTLYI